MSLHKSSGMSLFYSTTSIFIATIYDVFHVKVKTQMFRQNCACLVEPLSIFMRFRDSCNNKFGS